MHARPFVHCFRPEGQAGGEGQARQMMEEKLRPLAGALPATPSRCSTENAAVRSGVMPAGARGFGRGCLRVCAGGEVVG